MHPIFFRTDKVTFFGEPFTIYWFGVMMALAFLAGFANWVYLGKRDRVYRDFNFCADLLFWVIIAGIVGARLISVASDISYYMEYPSRIIRIDKGGITYYGGFMGAGLAILILARKHGENLVSLLDFVVTAVPLAHAFGRVGCFLNGCCHGILFNGAWAVQYPANTLPWETHLQQNLVNNYSPHSLPVHPVQLYEAAFNLLLYVVLFFAFRRRKRNGTVLALYLLIYPVGRFYFETLRGDDNLFMFGLTSSQLMSVILFLIGIVVLVYSMRRSMPANEVQSKI